MKRKVGLVILILLAIVLIVNIFNIWLRQKRIYDKYAVLTEQQEEILTVQGFPLEYRQLDASQKLCLEKADEMMTYINEKYAPYGVHFSYHGYHMPEILDPIHRIVCIPIGYTGDDVVVVKCNRDSGEYSDDYLKFATSQIYPEVIYDYFAEFLPEDKFRVYVTDGEVIDMPIADLPSLDKDYILEHVSSSYTLVYISDEVCATSGEFIKFTEDYFSWLEEHNFRGVQSIWLYMDEGIQKIQELPLEELPSYSMRKDYALEHTHGFSNSGESYVVKWVEKKKR